jgi:hypothetical protein
MLGLLGGMLAGMPPSKSLNEAVPIFEGIFRSMPRMPASD